MGEAWERMGDSTKIRGFRNVSSSGQAVFITDDGEAKIRQLSPRKWEVLPRGGEAFRVGSKQEAVDQAKAISTGLTSTHVGALEQKRRQLEAGLTSKEIEHDVRQVVNGGEDVDFTIRVGQLGYRVTVRSDPYRGGYVARLIADGIGTVMEPNGSSRSDALARLVSGLSAGDVTDRKIAREIELRSGGGEASRRGNYPDDLIAGDVVMRRDIRGRKKYRVSHTGRSGGFVQVYAREVGSGSGQIVTFDRSQLRLAA